MPTPDKYKLKKKYIMKDGDITEQPTAEVTEASAETPATEVPLPETSETPLPQDDIRSRLRNKYGVLQQTKKPQKTTDTNTGKAEIDVEASYTTERPIETGSFTELPDIENIEYNGLTISDFRQMYSDNGGNTAEVDSYITSHLSSIKDDPNEVRNFMSTFLTGLKSDLFDSGKNTCSFGEDTEEILSHVLSQPEGERLTGWVCSNIHDLGMRYMHKSGMEAAVVSCKQNMGAGHAILIYKSGDGKYTFLNYGHASEVEAKNMVDAVCKLQSSDSSLMSNGTICFVDENGSYCKYALKDDALWGDRIDKTGYNKDIPTAGILPKKSGVSVELNTTNVGDQRATIEGNILLGKHKRTAITGGIGYQTNSNSQIFDHSQGFGANLGIKTVSGGDKTKTYFGADAIVDYTLANYTPIPTDDGQYRDQHAEYLTTFARGVAGIENKFNLSENTTLTNTTQLSANGYLAAGITLGTSFNGDGRAAVENALTLTHKTAGATIENTLNGGLLVDMKKTSGDQQMCFQLGSKFNAGSSIMISPDKNLSFGAGVDGYSVFTPTSTDYGVGARTFVTYKPDGSDITFTGNVGGNYSHQNIRIGGMHETTEDNTSFYASVSAKHKKNTFSVGYNGKFDGINTTRNNSTFMVKYTRTF